MTTPRLTVRACVLTALLMTVIAAIAASGAAAATFYVNQRNGSDAEPCTSKGGLKPPEFPCATINGAIKKAEAVPGPNVIEVASGEGVEGLYHESINLNSKDAGLTINGEEPGVVILGKAGPAVSTNFAGTATLSNLKARTSESAISKATIVDQETALTLDNVEVENESTGVNGIEARKHGSVTINGGSVEMESGASGDAIFAFESALALNGVKILNGGASEADAGGIYSEKSSLSVVNTHVAIESGTSTIDFGISAGHDNSVFIQNVAVRQNSPAMGVALEASPATVNGLRVEMVNPSSKVAALLSELEAPGASSTFSHVEIGGTWTGSGFLAVGGDITLDDSRVSTGALSGSGALSYVGSGSSRGLLVQRSVLQAGQSAKGTLVAELGNTTVDSSEILGGKSGISFGNTAASTNTLTLTASTLDAGGVGGVEAVAKGGPGSVANVAIQGSIVLEKQIASAAAGDQTNIGCSYSAVPSQAQAAGGGAGAITCASGANGNTEVNPLSTLFSEPIANYAPLPGSSAIDSVPASAISLPFGITPSSTDLLGNPRVVDGNGDCVALQDKGAIELQGHSAPCPKPPVAGSISNLSIAPNAFFAAPSGATISKTKRAKKKYGATVSYKDTQAATTTFTVLKPSSGRTQGKACKKPSKTNKHGKKCTIYTPLGSFTHTDTIGANKLHFSGRLKGRKLGKGSYRLQAVPHNAAGNGKAVSKTFKIK